MIGITTEPGDKIKVIAGPHAGRTGEFVKHCSMVFPDYCRVKLDLRGRERNQKVLMIEKKDVEAL